MNNDRRVVVQEQEVIQHQPSDASVAVGKRMDVFELAMKISRGSQRLFVGNVSSATSSGEAPTSSLPVT